MTDSTAATRRHPGAVAAAILGGVFVPFLGFASLEGGHPATAADVPPWVWVTLPFSWLGPEYPSVLVWAGLMAGNVVAWAAAAYWVVRSAERFLPRRSGRDAA